jgi:hypothetical protein
MELPDYCERAALGRVHTLNILGLKPFVTGDNFKGDLVAFIQRFEPCTGYGRMMHENVLPGTLGDEAKPFFVVKPLHFAACHNCS